MMKCYFYDLDLELHVEYITSPTTQNLELQATYIYFKKKSDKMKHVYDHVFLSAPYTLFYPLWSLYTHAFHRYQTLLGCPFLTQSSSSTCYQWSYLLVECSKWVFLGHSNKKYFRCQFSSSFDKILGWSVWMLQLWPSLHRLPNSLKIDLCSCCSCLLK